MEVGLEGTLFVSTLSLLTTDGGMAFFSSVAHVPLVFKLLLLAPGLLAGEAEPKRRALFAASLASSFVDDVDADGECPLVPLILLILLGQLTNYTKKWINKINSLLCKNNKTNQWSIIIKIIVYRHNNK